MTEAEIFAEALGAEKHAIRDYGEYVEKTPDPQDVKLFQEIKSEEEHHLEELSTRAQEKGLSECDIDCIARLVVDGIINQGETVNIIREAATKCRDQHPSDNKAFVQCFTPAFGRITKGENPGKEAITSEVIKQPYLEKYRGLVGKYPDRIDKHIERAKDEKASIVLGRMFGESFDNFLGRRPDIKRRWDELTIAIKEMEQIKAEVPPKAESSNPGTPGVAEELRGLRVIIANIRAQQAEGWALDAGAKKQLELALRRQAELTEKSEKHSNPGKETWQMTREEWLVDVGYKKSQGSRVRENWLGTHEGEVRVAIQNRKPVPPEVLKDYPELKEK